MSELHKIIKRDENNFKKLIKIIEEIEERGGNVSKQFTAELNKFKSKEKAEKKKSDEEHQERISAKDYRPPDSSLERDFRYGSY